MQYVLVVSYPIISFTELLAVTSKLGTPLACLFFISAKSLSRLRVVNSELDELD